MTAADALPRLYDVCVAGATHADYARTVALAQLYRSLATGVGIELLMRQYATQETDEQYRSRVAMMITTVPAWWEQARKKFYEVARLRGGTVIKRYDYPTDLQVTEIDRLKERLTQAVNHYYQNKSLEAYLAEHLAKSHCMSDPNAWLLTEFLPFDFRTQVAQPYPLLVPCEAAVDYGRAAGVTQWFTARFSIKQSASHYRYICYVENEAVDAWPVIYDGDIATSTIPGGPIAGQVFREATTDGTEGKLLYEYRVLANKPGRAPVSVAGYVIDEEGTGESFVSPLHAGVCFLRQSLKVGSENDIVMSQMSSPIRAAYAEDCPGEFTPDGGRYDCVNGVNPTLMHRCSECNGTGKLTTASTTAAKTITVPYPKPGEDIPVKPGDAMAFIGPNVENPKFQVEYLDRAGKLFMQTIFGDYDGARVGAKTATEDKIDQQSELTALAPFADWFSGTYVYHAGVAAAYVDAGSPEVKYEFPPDLEKITLDDLFDQREKAVKAGADNNQLEALDSQIAIKQYATDPDGLLRNQVKRRFITFLGYTIEQVNAMYMLGGIRKNDWLARVNADIIFGELEIERPEFYQLAYAAQVPLVQAKIDTIAKELPSPAAALPRMNLSPTLATA